MTWIKTGHLRRVGRICQVAHKLKVMKSKGEAIAHGSRKMGT